MSAATADYTARDLSVLEGLEAVRKRPGMYIGSTDSRGLQHCVWEIIDNSVDEALAGHCKHITVVLHPDESLEVRDDGRGIPVDIEPKTGLTGARGRDDQAARRRQVRRRLVQRLRRSARRRRLGGQRAVRTARRRGRPRRQGARDVLPARRSRRLRRAGGPRAVPPRGRPAHRQEDRQDRHRHPRAVLARPAHVFIAEAAIDLDELHSRARQTAFLVPGPDHRRTRRAGPGER